ncbi:MAG: hypothetical protein AAB421_01545 [Patescibacteria group bacterium]
MALHTQLYADTPEVWIRKTVTSFVGRKFRILQLVAVDHANWMTMIMLPDKTTKRFRSTGGSVVDEITVGD